MKKLILLTIITTLLLAACQSEKPKTSLSVLTSTFAAQDLSENLFANSPLPINIEPIFTNSDLHNFDPKPEDIIKISKADIIILNGADLETWTEIIEINNPNSLTILLSNGLQKNLLETNHQEEIHDNDENDDHEHEHEDEHEDDHHDYHENEQQTEETLKNLNEILGNTSPTNESHNHNHNHNHNTPYDPHFWLDPQLQILAANYLTEEVSSKFPELKETLNKNLKSYTAELKALTTQIHAGLSLCPSKTIITEHQAYSYFANRFGLKAYSIYGLSSDNEPTPTELAEIINILNKLPNKIIFYSPNSISPILNALTTTTSTTLHPLDTLEQFTDSTYINRMQNNLQTLKLALNCP